MSALLNITLALGAASGIRTYYLAGTAKDPPVASCDGTIEALETALFGDVPNGEVDRNAVYTCKPGADGKPSSFQWKIALEAANEAAVPATAATVAAHDGTSFWGVKLHYREVFGVLSDASLRFLDAPAELKRFDGRRMFQNMQEQHAAVTAATDTLKKSDTAALLAWIGRDFGAAAAEAARTRWLHAANVVRLRVEPVLIFADRRVGSEPTSFKGGDRDCRRTASGRCL